MAGKDSNGSKTEKPTPKKLKDARKKGDVPRSKDLTSLLLLFYWLAFLAFFGTYITNKLVSLLDNALAFHSYNGDFYVQFLSHQALDIFIALSIALLIPAALIGLLTTFLQIGPVFTMEKIKPKLEYLNPVSGIKRMFSMDNLIEVLKSILKTVLLFLIALLAFNYISNDIFLLLFSEPESFAKAIWSAGFNLILWTAFAFCIVSTLDSVYQKHSFSKKMRMSTRDIKQEHKDSEGDPLLKQERQRKHKEVSEQNTRSVTSAANVLLVNPTHVAVAIQYDKILSPIPTVIAKGHDDIAALMREAARDNKIPILRNVQLARQLYTDVAENQVIPSELFDIVAEIILWAQEVKDMLDTPFLDRDTVPNTAPGEDLSDYSLA